MCLWLLTACLGLIPTTPQNSNVIVIQGLPTPIIQPTTLPANTTAFPPVTFPTVTIPPFTFPPTVTIPTITFPPTVTIPPVTFPPTVTIPPVTGVSPTTGGVSLAAVIVCNNSDVICVANPDDIDTGPLPIDPRLGTTPGPSAALQLPTITGYSAQGPSYDTSVRFPREKRSMETEDDTMLQVLYSYKNIITENHKIIKRQSCACVPNGTCATPGTNNGAGLIDLRIVTPGQGQCPAGQVYCCTGTVSQIACGILQATPNIAVQPAAGQANYGEYPWQVMILTRQNDYVAGGVLIDSLNVLTVTHRLMPYIVSGTAPNIKVRLGEWDAAGTYEPVPYKEVTIQKVFNHPSYNPNTLQFGITVLRLATPVTFTPAVGSAVTINRACLPPNSASTYVGQRCWVAGWGKNMFGTQGQFQQILKEVDVPIVASATCQSQLQAARLGPSFVLDTTSFICAGGEPNKDACTGDGGSGLVCSVNGQWVLVGLVSWGLGCASSNVPGVYINIAALLPWIQQQVATP